MQRDDPRLRPTLGFDGGLILILQSVEEDCEEEDEDELAGRRLTG
jgi:hypothetical protein